jgi:hypothetical protein
MPLLLLMVLCRAADKLRAVGYVYSSLMSMPSMPATAAAASESPPAAKKSSEGSKGAASLLLLLLLLLLLCM